jgi:hypothetical protein
MVNKVFTLFTTNVILFPPFSSSSLLLPPLLPSSSPQELSTPMMGDGGRQDLKPLSLAYTVGDIALAPGSR